MWSSSSYVILNVWRVSVSVPYRGLPPWHGGGAYHHHHHQRISGSRPNGLLFPSNMSIVNTSYNNNFAVAYLCVQTKRCNRTNLTTLCCGAGQKLRNLPMKLVSLKPSNLAWSGLLLEESLTSSWKGIYCSFIWLVTTVLEFVIYAF